STMPDDYTPDPSNTTDENWWGAILGTAVTPKNSVRVEECCLGAQWARLLAVGSGRSGVPAALCLLTGRFPSSRRLTLGDLAQSQMTRFGSRWRPRRMSHGGGSTVHASGDGACERGRGLISSKKECQ